MKKSNLRVSLIRAADHRYTLKYGVLHQSMKKELKTLWLEHYCINLNTVHKSISHIYNKCNNQSMHLFKQLRQVEHKAETLKIRIIRQLSI